MTDDGRTSSGRAAVALPRERAVFAIKGPDHRPLLVVRECGFCKGTDDALMNRRLNNEKTLLLTKWFHCVKLPNHVLNADHPFRNLFAAEHPPHLFLCRHDGSGVVDMDGQQTQAQLWAAMESMIAREYDGDCRTAVRGLLRVLNEYDTLDSQEAELLVRLEETLDKDGPKSPKVRALQRKLESFTKERAELEKREAALLGLPLKPLPADAGAAADAAVTAPGSGQRDG